MEALVAVVCTPSKLCSKAPDSAKIHRMEALIFRSDWSNLGDRDDPDDVMETSLTIDYDKLAKLCFCNRPIMSNRIALLLGFACVSK